MRVAIVFDGNAWFVRRIRLIQYNVDRDETVYHCDLPISNDHKTLDDAVAAYQLREHPTAAGSHAPTCLTLGNGSHGLCTVHQSILTTCEVNWTRLSRENRLRKNHLDSLPLCPDHRDKVQGQPCLKCSVEEMASYVLRLIPILEAATPLLPSAKQWVDTARERAMAAEGE